GAGTIQVVVMVVEESHRGVGKLCLRSEIQTRRTDRRLHGQERGASLVKGGATGEAFARRTLCAGLFVEGSAVKRGGGTLGVARGDALPQPCQFVGDLVFALRGVLVGRDEACVVAPEGGGAGAIDLAVQLLAKGRSGVAQVRLGRGVQARRADRRLHAQQ